MACDLVKIVFLYATDIIVHTYVVHDSYKVDVQLYAPWFKKVSSFRPFPPDIKAEN